MPVFGGVKG